MPQALLPTPLPLRPRANPRRNVPTASGPASRGRAAKGAGHKSGPRRPKVRIVLSKLYAATEQAKLADLPRYEVAALAQVPPGADVILTGKAPVWLYLRIAHALHGRARILTYDSPVTGPVEIFNHNPR